MHNRPIAIIEAPSSLGLRSAGVEGLAGRLLELGLAERIGARLAGRLMPPTPDPRKSPDGILNADAIAAWSPKLADAVAEVLAADEFPLILGGDCTILLGPMLALRRRGRYGLLFIDGHADFFQWRGGVDGARLGYGARAGPADRSRAAGTAGTIE